MDGVPGLSFSGIPTNATFTYRIPVRQSAPIGIMAIPDFRAKRSLRRDCHRAARRLRATVRSRYVVLLSDWSDERPETIVSNLKFQSDYYNHAQRTAGAFFSDARRNQSRRRDFGPMGLGQDADEPDRYSRRLGRDLCVSDHGRTSASNWTALFRPGERVRLRFINGLRRMSIFDVRIPGLTLTVVQADGNDVEPVTVEEFRIGTAETTT